VTTAARWWRHRRKEPVQAVTVEPPKRKWKFRRTYSMTEFEVPDIKWVERYVVGTTHPKKPLTQKEIQKQLDMVNRALRYGKIVAIEQNFTDLTNGEKDIVTQYTVYHVGFKHRPPGK